jgi:histidyl-tRNA synthetase
MSKPASIAAVRGFRDVLAPESERWQALERQAAAVFGTYGFTEIRLPVLERSELFARSLGETTDVVEKEMYSFEDRDGTWVTLRPEATASVVRAYVETGLVHQEPQARLWYAGPMFRRERPQKGRYRQFNQIGTEVFGRADALVDAELLVMLTRYLEAVGARDTRLELNSLGDGTCRPAYREALREFGRRHLDALCLDCHRRIERNPLRLLDCKVETCRRITADAPLIADALCDACREHLASVRRLLDAEGVPYVFAPRLVRGLDYYCRTAFEIVSDALGAQNALGGGGRYDGLVAALGGPDVPGVGFAIGLDRLAMVLEPGASPTPDVAVLPLVEAAAPAALALATRLRAQGVSVLLEAPGRSLKAMLRAVSRQAARVAVILGDDELAAGRATIRDLERRLDRPLALSLDADGATLLHTLREQA